MKGKYPAPTRRITDVIKKIPKDSKENVKSIYVAEVSTSQICNQFKIKTLLFQLDQNEKYMLFSSVTLVAWYGIVI